MDHRTFNGSESAERSPSTSDDVWIEIMSPVQAGSYLASFFGMSTARPIYPHDPNGPWEARAWFNLTGYVRHEIAKASAASGDRTAADATTEAR